MQIPAPALNALHQYFDKIVVVSVPRFKDRHARVSKNLFGLSFDFFWGTDKLELNESKLKESIYDEKKAAQLQRQGLVLNLGEIACALSHRSLYETMIANNWEKVLVLEDDVVALLPEMKDLPQTLAELPHDWELVYLGYLKHEVVTPGLAIKQFFYKILSAVGLMKWDLKMVNNLLPKSYSRHLKKAGFHDCTHAYALTKQGAQKLLEAQTPLVYRADDLLSSTIMQGKLQAYITVPKFFDQEIFSNPGIGSEIRD